MRKIKISIVGSVGVPANYGGFESLVENLIDFTPSNFNYTVFCSAVHYKKQMLNYKGANLEYIKLKANGYSSVIYDGLSLYKSICLGSDVILLLGVSGAIFLPFVKLFTKTRIICNIDGIEWRRDKWGPFAKAFLKYSESLAIKFSDVIITDNKGINEYVKSNYDQNAITIPYGAQKQNKFFSNIPVDLGLHDENYAFKVCRIEPENNIEMILEAFSSTSYPLIIVGNWMNSIFGKSLKEKFKGFENLSLLDPIYDLNKLNALRTRCSFYVHGHSAGGTNPSLVEAMALKLPVIAFDVNFNRYTMCNNGIYFKNKEELINCIKSIDKEELYKIGQKNYKLYELYYTREKIARSYENLIDESF